MTKALEESLKPLKLKVEVSYVNRSQITIVVATAVVLVITLFFPPFHYVAGRGAVSGEEFSFVLTPPKEYYTVDVTLLAIELCTCLVVGGLVYFVASGKRPSRL